MNKNTINDLIALADLLDSHGSHDEAGEIDSIVSSAAKRVSTIDGFIIMLKETLSEAVNNPGLPTISDKSVKEIFSIIDAIKEESYISTPSSSGDASIESIHSMANYVTRIGEGILALTDDIKRLKQQIDQMSEDEERNEIIKDYEGDLKKLELLKEKAAGLNDVDKEELQQFFDQRGR